MISIMDGMSAPFPPDAEVKRWRFKSSDVQRMLETGILPEKAPVELIRGELIEMTPEGGPHWDGRQRLTSWFSRRLPPHVELAPDGPLRLSEEDEPEPDFFLFPATMRVNDVRGSDTLLVVEISHSSIRKDIKIKTPIYAGYGVREYWIVDLNDRRTLVHRNPSPDGYPKPTEIAFTQPLSCAALPELAVRIADIL
jgi:Uma2 family endonuclease